jgi:hypothetical protein
MTAESPVNVVDWWQAALEGVVPTGLDEGKGGKFVFLPLATPSRCRKIT